MRFFHDRGPLFLTEIDSRRFIFHKTGPHMAVFVLMGTIVYVTLARGQFIIYHVLHAEHKVTWQQKYS